MFNIDLGFQVYLLIRHIGTSFCKATSNVDHSSTASFCLSDAIHCCIQQPEQNMLRRWSNSIWIRVWLKHPRCSNILRVPFDSSKASHMVGRKPEVSKLVKYGQLVLQVLFSRHFKWGAFSRHPYPSSARLPPSSPAVALASRDMRWNGWAVCKPFLLSFSSFAVFMLSYFSITPASEVLRLIPIPIPIPFLRNQTEGFPLCIYDIYVNGPLNSPQSGVAHCTHESFSNRKFG